MPFTEKPPVPLPVDIPRFDNAGRPLRVQVEFERRFLHWLIDLAAVAVCEPVTSFKMQSPNGSIFTISIGNDGRLVSTPATGTALTFAPVTRYGVSTNYSPAGVANAAYLMQGLGLSIIGGVENAAWVTADGQISNSSNNSRTDVVICYGTGTAPVNGAPQAGTIACQPASYIATAANDFVPWSLTALLTGLVSGTTYWIDLAVRAPTGGTGTINAVDFTVHGLA